MTTSDLQAHNQDPARLAALHTSALLDSPSEEAFDRLSRIAARLLDAPVALVSLVDANRQFFKSCVGLTAEPWSSDRETPLTHSFCQHNRVAGQPLVVQDARIHPVFKDNLAIRDLDVVAYLGFPLTTEDGYVLGSFCVIDTKPRAWAPDDVQIVRDLAAAVMVEINFRAEIANRHQVEGERDNLNDANTQLIAEIKARELAEEQQRALEARLHQTRKIEAIGQLAGGIAHDLNNLLSPILIYTSILLREDEMAEKHLNIVDQIQDTGLKARDLIRQLLTFSRMQAMQFDVLDLNEIVAGLQTLLRRTIPEDIQMTVACGPEPTPILADSSQIEQILLNLVVNAADAMRGGGLLQIETTTTMLDEAAVSSNDDAQPGQFATLIVTDDGTGMDPDIQERVFEPFFSTKANEGNGLGLATVLGIVLGHGGVIDCSSELGTGTTFRVHLPVTTEKADIAAPVAKEGLDTAGSATILVAEDDEQVRRLTSLVLTEHGYNVISAEDSQDALATLKYHDEPIHLLLTDVVMPGINGRELFEKASEDRPGLKVLFMSGYTDDIISRRGVLESGIDFIPKPFTEDELLAQVHRVLKPAG